MLINIIYIIKKKKHNMMTRTIKLVKKQSRHSTSSRCTTYLSILFILAPLYLSY